MTKASYLYLIEFGHALKVGISWKPERRIQQHQKAMETFGLDATVKRSWIGPQCYNASTIERSVVQKFSPNGREWIKGDFNEILTFIESSSFKTELMPEDIARSKAADEALAQLIMPKASLKDTLIPAWVIPEVLEIQNALTEQAFCLLHNNYICMDMEPPEDDLDIFFMKMFEASFRASMLSEYQDFAMSTRAANDREISTSELAGYFMEDFLKKHGLKPYSPFWTSEMSPDEAERYVASVNEGQN